MSFDPRCFELASLFLEDEPLKWRSKLCTEKNKNELAQELQTCCEDFIMLARKDAGVGEDD